MDNRQVTCVYRQNPRVATRNFRGEAAFITPEDRRINILNISATAIWELCENDPMSLDDICRVMAERFDGEPETIRQDVQELLDDLVELGALIRQDTDAE